MNQLFVRVVLLCFVVVCSLYVIKHGQWNKNIVIKSLTPDRNPSFNRYDVLLYGSTRNLNSLSDIEMQLATCNQQTGLLDVEINNLQNQISEKKQQNLISCQNKLKQRFGIYKRLYKSINSSDISNRELLELENKIGLENKLEP